MIYMKHLLLAAMVGAVAVGGLLALADKFLDIKVCDGCDGCEGCEGCDEHDDCDETCGVDEIDEI